MHPLYLTAEERKLFDALPDAVRNGWKVEEETITFTDTPEKQGMRIALSRLHDERVMKLQKSVQTAKTPSELVKYIEQASLEGMSEDDLVELFFVLGPGLVSLMIGELLKTCGSDDDLRKALDLIEVRHTLLASFQSNS